MEQEEAYLTVSRRSAQNESVIMRVKELGAISAWNIPKIAMGMVSSCCLPRFHDSRGAYHPDAVKAFRAQVSLGERRRSRRYLPPQDPPLPHAAATYRRHWLPVGLFDHGKNRRGLFNTTRYP